MRAQPLGQFFRVIRMWCTAWLFLMMVIPTINWAQAQQQMKPTGSEPVPEPAIPAILAAFDRYEVVAMPEAHGMKDVDDFIFSLKLECCQIFAFVIGDPLSEARQ